MYSLGCWQIGQRRVGWALALLVGVLATPAAARASCGDYVRMGGAGGHGTATDDRHTPAPCHGPGCKQHPASPPAPVTAPVQIEQWGCVLPADGSPGCPPGFTHGEENPPRPIKRPSAVFHPPRRIVASASR